jgi:membrane fusion protein (multidrug efflux system)
MDNTQNHNNGRGTATLPPKPLVPNSLNQQTLDQQTLDQRPLLLDRDGNELVVDQPQVAPPPQSPKSRFNKKRLLSAVLGVGAIVAGTFGYRWWEYASTHEQTDDAAVAGHVYQISSRISGTVLTVPVNDNQEVHQGELLVRLDPHDYQVKVQQAQASLAVARRQAEAAQSNISLAGQTAQAQTTEAQGNVSNAIAAISAAEAAVKEAQAGVPAAQATLAQANATLEKNQADYARYQSLYESGAVSKQQLDSAKAAYETALAQKNAAQQGISQAQAKLAQAQQGVTQAQAQLEASRGGLQKAQASGVQTDVNRSQYEAANASINQAQANLAEAQLQLSYTNITAPETGRVGHKTVEVGNRVQVGQPLMAVVGDDMWVVANFKETQLSHMRPGESVEVNLDAFPDHPFIGHVDSLSPASGSQFALLPPDNATGNFTKVVQRIPVKIVLDPASIKGYESQIAPGMSAVVSVDVAGNH